jgi:UDP-N-acetylglucosamine acyltransferase
MMQHNLSHIHPDATIGKNVRIDPFVSIQNDVIIGDNTWIGSNVTIMSGTRIGANCKIFQGAVIGAEPQDLKFKGEYTTVEIGDNVTIREYATVNRGTETDGKTIIKDNVLLMSYVHVAHDCIIGKDCVLASYVGLAGHVEIEDYAILGGYAAVHQFTKIGQHAFIRGASLVTKDVPPFIKAVRDPIYFSGVNIVGLRRRGFKRDEISDIEDIYRVIFNKGLNTSQAVDYIKENMADIHHVNTIINFIESSTRGIIKGNVLNGHKVETAL